MDKPRIMVVDDDAEIRELLQAYLEKNGLSVATVADGVEMRRALSQERPDLLILDIMLPGDDGLSLCRELRANAETAELPIIMLTARGEDMDRILGLEMGADDYLPKPFNPRELLARIKVVLRRAQRGHTASRVGEVERLHFAGWTLDLTGRHLIDRNGVVVPLSGGEYRLLRIFLEHPNRVLSRDQILDLLHGREWMPFDRSIDVQISRLRKRLHDDGKRPDIIRTVRGEGYVLAAKVVPEP